MHKKVLVTGANGQLAETIKELYAKNDIGLDFTFVNKSELDITNKEHLDVLLNTSKFHYCINCAAYTNVEQAEKTPEMAFKVNAEGVRQLAEACKVSNIILIHISTDYVFDGEKEAFSVNDETNPINEYGKSKLLGEKYIQNILNQYFIIRTSWLYSKKYGHNFYKIILKKAQKAKELSVTVDQTGCPTDAVNLSNYIVKLIHENSTSFGIYHFCDKKIMTWYAFAEQILLENNLSKKIKLVRVNRYPTFAKRPRNSVLKC